MFHSNEKTVSYICSLVGEHPDLAPIFERALALEQQGKNRESYLGWEWHEVRCAPQTLNRLVLQGVVEVALKTNSGTYYKLCAPEVVSQAVEVWKAGIETQEPAEEEIAVPDDIFDVVIGHEKIKRLLQLSLKAE